MTYTLTLADASYLADLDPDHLEYQADPCSYQYQPEYKLAALAELRNRYAPRGQRTSPPTPSCPSSSSHC
jgi:hypothetical protein